MPWQHFQSLRPNICFPVSIETALLRYLVRVNGQKFAEHHFSIDFKANCSSLNLIPYFISLIKKNPQHLHLYLNPGSLSNVLASLKLLSILKLTSLYELFIRNVHYISTILRSKSLTHTNGHFDLFVFALNIEQKWRDKLVLYVLLLRCYGHKFIKFYFLIKVQF